MNASSRWILLTPFLFLAIIGTATAHIDPGADGLGIYYDGGVPVTGANCDCPPPVSDRATSWSAIKSVYR